MAHINYLVIVDRKNNGIEINYTNNKEETMSTCKISHMQTKVFNGIYLEIFSKGYNENCIVLSFLLGTSEDYDVAGISIFKNMSSGTFMTVSSFNILAQSAFSN